MYQCQVLPFGLNTATQVFTRLGHTVTAYLHRQGIWVTPLSGRLVDSPPGPSSFVTTSGSAIKYDRPCRLHSESKEIRTGPHSGPPVSRNSLTFGPRESFTPRVQGLGDSCSRTPSILPQGTKLFSSVPASGVTQLGLRSYPSGSFVPETYSTSLSFVRSDRPVYATASIRPLGPCKPTSAMAGPAFSYLRNPDPPISGGRFSRKPPIRAGAPTWGIPRFWVPGPLQTANSTSTVWSSKRLLLPYSIGLLCFRAARSWSPRTIRQ